MALASELGTLGGDVLTRSTGGEVKLLGLSFGAADVEVAGAASGLGFESTFGEAWRVSVHGRGIIAAVLMLLQAAWTAAFAEAGIASAVYR